MGVKNIAVFIGGLQFDSQRKFIEGVRQRIKEDGNRLFIFASDCSSGEKFNKGEMGVFALPDLSDFDGIIFYAETIYSEEVRNDIIKKIKKSGIPVISINTEYPDMLFLTDDNWDVMQEMIDRLVEEKSVKKVNYIAGHRFSRDDSTRRESCFAALLRHGITVPEDRVYYGNFQASSGRDAIEYFKDKNLLDADVYICSNDQMALGAFYRLKEEGINVPEDALLTGFDNIFMARNHAPRITTVDRNERKSGGLAYDMLLNYIRGNDDAKRKIKVPCSVKWGESCGFEGSIQDDVTIALNHHTRVKLRSDRYTTLLSDFTSEMSAIVTIEDFIRIFSNCILRFECKEFYLCLNDGDGADRFDVIEDGSLYKEDSEIATDYTDTLKNIIAYKQGEFLPVSYVRKGEIIPGGLNNAREGAVYVISSVHYLERSYGYAVISDSQLPMEENYYHMFIMNVANCLELIRDKALMKNMIKHLDEMSIYDPLTHIYNRNGFMKYAAAYIEQARREKHQLIVLFMDLDHLKKVNDEMGHDKGDMMIKAAADILVKCKRPDELLMRYGGDEYVLLGKNYTDIEAEDYIKRIHENMSEYSKNMKLLIPLEASVGYAMVDGAAMTEPLTSLIKIADQKMYDIKKEKRKARL